MHNLMTYAEGSQKYGIEYFTNLEEIKVFWSDVIDIEDWGSISKSEYKGGSRTYIYGRIK